MNRHILIVEDDTDIRESVSDVLRGRGHTVVVAENGADALSLLRSMDQLPDLIFLDLMMPVKDGYQFRSEQRADARLAEIPVVVMSADPQLDTKRDALAAREYLRKPFDLGTLLAAARN